MMPERDNPSSYGNTAARDPTLPSTVGPKTAYCRCKGCDSVVMGLVGPAAGWPKSLQGAILLVRACWRNLFSLQNLSFLSFVGTQHPIFICVCYIYCFSVSLLTGICLRMNTAMAMLQMSLGP